MAKIHKKIYVLLLNRNVKFKQVEIGFPSQSGNANPTTALSPLDALDGMHCTLERCVYLFTIYIASNPTDPDPHPSI